MPRIHVVLRRQGLRCGRKRVARLMRTAGLQGCRTSRRYRTTLRERRVAPAPDLVDRLFAAEAPDRLWVADITYCRTWEGFVHLAVVLDAFSRKVVGWEVAVEYHLGLAGWEAEVPGLPGFRAQGKTIEQVRSDVLRELSRVFSVPPSRISLSEEVILEDARMVCCDLRLLRDFYGARNFRRLVETGRIR